MQRLIAQATHYDFTSALLPFFVLCKAAIYIFPSSATFSTVLKSLSLLQVPRGWSLHLTKDFSISIFPLIMHQTNTLRFSVQVHARKNSLDCLKQFILPSWISFSQLHSDSFEAGCFGASRDLFACVLLLHVPLSQPGFMRNLKPSSA